MLRCLQELSAGADRRAAGLQRKYGKYKTYQGKEAPSGETCGQDIEDKKKEGVARSERKEVRTHEG